MRELPPDSKTNKHHDYSIFHDFISMYEGQGFQSISRLNPFIIALEEKLRSNNQFFYIADLLKVKILFTSWGSQNMIGISPEQVDPFTFFPRAHPEDQEQLNRAQTKLYERGQDLYAQQHKEITIVSIQIRELNGNGEYFDLLLQTYSYYSTTNHTVITLLVATDLTNFILTKDTRHYYVGNDLAMFRFPDQILLKVGHAFTLREMEILNLIAAGFGSEQIADKLFLSVNTINTHRRNILHKSKKSTTHEVVIELRERGIM